ncbi:MAG: VapE domain-containing protein [Salinarimonas sp.]
MLDNLIPDAERAIEFMSWLNPGAPLYLEHMRSDGPPRPTAKPYPAHDGASAKRFVTANNRDDLRRNMYWLPNAEFLTGKRLKANLTAARFLHVDLDCKDYPGTEEEQADRIIGLLLDERERPKGIPSPSAVWFTGGGYQAVWRMAERIGIEQAEELNGALLAALQGGPGTHDPSRLLRLPGTVNWLNDKKRKDGRTPARAYVIEPANLGAPPADFIVGDFKLRISKEAAHPALSRGTATVDVAALEPLPLPDDLGEVVPLDEVWAEVIVSGKNPPTKVYPSRSELVFAATLWLLGKNVAPGHVVSILTNADLGISAHVRENPNPLRYARRQVARAMETIDLRGRGWPKLDQYARPVANAPENVRFALAMLDVDARRNMFTHADEVTGLGLEGRDISDICDILCSIFDRKLDFRANVTVIRRELITVAYERAYHPVIDYLDGLIWDGVPRLDTWLSDYCEVDDTELNREFGARFLIGGVRRIKQPGVKFDTMLVLEGRQGVGKSLLAARLAVRAEWFCGNLNLNADAKTKAELVSRAWIVECQELDGARKATLDAIKAFLATPIDTYRPAYAHTAGSFPRHCVIVGTTNEDAYLRDPTGNRRYWPVKVGSIDIESFSRDVHQLWAEAVVREQAGEPITLPQHLWHVADELQVSRMVEDPIGIVLEGAFGERTGRVSMESVKLLLGYEAGRMSASEFQRIIGAMTALGWEYGTHRLHDLGRTGRSARKGFARVGADEQRTEWVAKRVEGGIAVLHAVGGHTEESGPF